MGNTNIGVRSGIQVDIHPRVNNGADTAKRFRKLDGSISNRNLQRNNSKMGESVQNIINTLGLSSLIFGFIVNFDNVLGWLMGTVGLVWGIIRCMHAHENLLIRRLRRKQMERDYKANRDLQEEEEDEYGKIK